MCNVAERLDREQIRGFSTIAFIGDRFVGLLRGWAFMRVALGANDGIVKRYCGFFGDGRDIFAENDPRAHRALSEAGAARHYEKAPPLRGWGFGFFDGGFGLWDEVFDRVAPFAGDFVGADDADADLHDGSGGQAFDGGAGAGGRFDRRPSSVGGFVLDLVRFAFGDRLPHDVELGGLVAKGDGDGGHFWHAGGGDGRGFEGEDECADFGREGFHGVASGRLGEQGAGGGGCVVSIERGCFGELRALGGGGGFAFQCVCHGGEFNGGGIDAGKRGGVIGEALGHAPDFGDEFCDGEFVEFEDYLVHFVWFNWDIAVPEEAFLIPFQRHPPF